MVLPIISSLASVSSSISLISTGLTGISSIIGGLGSALASAFTTGLLASVQFYDEFKTNTQTFLDEFIDLHVTAFQKIKNKHDSVLGKMKGDDDTSKKEDKEPYLMGERMPSNYASYLELRNRTTPVATFDSPRKSFADMETRHPLAGLESTLDGLRYLIENEGGLVQAINRKAGETNVTVNVHGGAMERRAAMAVGNIIKEEINRKTGVQQKATRYL